MNEYEAFTQVMLYHTKTDISGCRTCGQMPLGSSHVDHQWEIFNRLRGRE